MTIGLLHLSDIHFKGDGSSPISGRDGVIAGTLAAAEPDCGAYVVLISGDLAFSGKPQEYAEAEQFLNRLRTALSQLNAQPSVQMVAIPGNHDCNFEHNSETRKMASEYLHRRMDDFKPTGDLAQKCLAVQDNFFNFHSRLVEAAPLDQAAKFVWKHQLKVPGHQIEIVCINSAWMSQEHEQQGSLLVLTPSLRGAVTGVSSQHDLIVTMIHHPYNWFAPEAGREVRELVEASSDLILSGHEHVSSLYAKELFSGESTQYFEGGVLHDPEGQMPSTFNCFFIDLEQGMQRAKTFTWSGGMYLDKLDGVQWRPLRRNTALTKQQFKNNDDFQRRLDDIGTGFTHGRKREIKLSGSCQEF